MAVSERTRARALGPDRLEGRGALEGEVDALLVGVALDRAGLGVDEHDVAILQRRGSRRADDRGDALLPGEDRGVRGGAAVGRDEGEHQLEVERRGVGGREVARDEDERSLRLGHARRGQPAQVGDGPLRDVVEVTGALPQVAPHAHEHVAEAAHRRVDRVLGGRTVLRAVLHVGRERRVLRHHGESIQNLGRRRSPPAAAAASPSR